MSVSDTTYSYRFQLGVCLTLAMSGGAQIPEIFHMLTSAPSAASAG
jgi:hypothetical protein